MQPTVALIALHRQFRKTFDEVAEEHVPYVLTRGSRPEAVLLSYEQYLRFIRADAEGIPKRFDDLLAGMSAANGRFSEEEVAKDVAAAVGDIRKRKK